MHISAVARGVGKSLTAGAGGDGKEPGLVAEQYASSLRHLLFWAQVGKWSAFLRKRQSKTSTTTDLMPLTLNSAPEVY